MVRYCRCCFTFLSLFFYLFESKDFLVKKSTSFCEYQNNWNIKYPQSDYFLYKVHNMKSSNNYFVRNIKQFIPNKRVNIIKEIKIKKEDARLFLDKIMLNSGISWLKMAIHHVLS